MKSFIAALLIGVVLISCANNGKKLSKDYLEVYYKDGITEQEAQKTLDFLLPLWKDEEGKTKTKSIQLTKTGDTVNFRMVFNKDLLGKIDDGVFYSSANEYSDKLFNGTPVNVELTDDKFKTVRSYIFKKQDFGDKINSGLIDVYVKGGFSMEHAQQLAAYLEKSINPEKPIAFQISQDTEGYYVLKMVSNREKAAQLTDAQLNEMAASVSDGVFNGAAVIFELTNSTFEPFKTVEYKKDAAVDTIAVQQ